MRTELVKCQRLILFFLWADVSIWPLFPLRLRPASLTLAWSPWCPRPAHPASDRTERTAPALTGLGGQSQVVSLLVSLS